MAIVGLTFLLILGIVLGAYFVFVVRPESGDRSRLLGRLGKTSIKSDLLKPGDLEARSRPAERRARGAAHALARQRGCRRRSSAS